MLRKYVAKIGLILVAISTAWNTSASAARDRSADVLVVPSRYTIVQFAFDIVALRGVSLVAYDNNSDSEEPLLHAWDAKAGTWKRITPDEYAVGAFSNTEPDEMFLIGSDAILPAFIIAGASQAKTVTRINTLTLMTVVNTLNKRMKFTSREWKLLADRHGLQIKDLNYERRKWGRYGPPGQKRKTSEDVKAMDEVLLEEVQESESAEAAPAADELGPVEEKGTALPLTNEEAAVVEEPETDIPEEPSLPVADEVEETMEEAAAADK